MSQRLVKILAFTYHGLAAIELELAVNILIDPGESKDEEFELLATVHPNFILVSHPTPEHMGQIMEIAARSQAIVISSKTVITVLQKTAPNLQYKTLAHAQSFDTGKDITITAYEQLPPLVPNVVNTVFYITSERASILHLGHARDLRGLPDHSPNLLCIPIGGPKYDVCTPLDAAEYTAQLEPEYVLPLMGTISKSTAFVIAVGAKKSEITTLYPAEGEHYTVPIYRKPYNKK